jgi:hypothetical protein
MRQVLNPVIRPVVDFARSLAEGWDAFWYTPADPTLLGVIRILTGLMLLYTHAVWGLALDDFFGPSGWLKMELVRAFQAGEFVCSFWWWVPAGWMWPAYAISMVILTLFTIGLWTRVTSVLALIVAISFAQRVSPAMFGLDQINVFLTLYLAIGPSGRALSVDRRLALRRRGAAAPPSAPSAGANLAQRLIQVHMCVAYFFAGTSKLQGPAWWNGEAMWRAFANLEYQSADMTWLAWHPWLVNLITHVSIAWELSFCVLIWLRLWRPLVLAGAVVLHLGIGLFLGMWTFGLVMLIGCASFLPAEAVRQFVAAWVPARAGRTPNTEASVVDRVGREGADAPVGVVVQR